MLRAFSKIFGRTRRRRLRTRPPPRASDRHGIRSSSTSSPVDPEMDIPPRENGPSSFLICGCCASPTPFREVHRELSVLNLENRSTPTQIESKSHHRIGRIPIRDMVQMESDTFACATRQGPLVIGVGEDCGLLCRAGERKDAGRMRVVAIAYASDSGLLFGGCHSQHAEVPIQMYRLVGDLPLRVSVCGNLQGHLGYVVRQLTNLPSVEHHLFSCSYGLDISIKKWDIPKQYCLKTILDGHSGRCPTSLCCSDELKVVVSGGMDKSIVVWDARSMEVVARHTRFDDRVAVVGFREEERQCIAVSNVGSVSVFDLRFSSSDSRLVPPWTEPLLNLPCSFENVGHLGFFVVGTMNGLTACTDQGKLVWRYQTGCGENCSLDLSQESSVDSKRLAEEEEERISFLIEAKCVLWLQEAMIRTRFGSVSGWKALIHHHT